MRKRTGVLCLSVAAALIGTTVAWKTTQSMEYKKGFVSIFDGKTLKGWEHDGVHWRVENGTLVGEITPENVLKTNNFIIWTGAQPENFELTCEFKISAGGNSGINYRSERVEGVPYALKGYQADIDGANRYTGQNYEERGRTTLAYRGQKTVIPAPTTSLHDGVKNNAWSAMQVVGSLGSMDSLQHFIKAEDWNKVRLVVKGNHLQHYVNGVLMSDVTDNDQVNGKTKGYIGVQVHVGPPSKVAYRNIMIKQL